LPRLITARTGREIDGRAIAGFDHDPFGAIGAEPSTGDDELRQCIGEFLDQRQPRRRRQIIQPQHRFANGGEMTVTLDDAIP